MTLYGIRAVPFLRNGVRMGQCLLLETVLSRFGRYILTVIIELLDEFIGDLVYDIPLEDGLFVGLSWHPDSQKLAFIDFPTGSTIRSRWISDSRCDLGYYHRIQSRHLPGVLAYWDFYPKDGKVIAWGPDGMRLAAISNDGRIIIWNTSVHLMLPRSMTVIDPYWTIMWRMRFFTEQELDSAD